MAGRIPPEFIDQLLARVDIVDVIDARIHLKKAGRDYQALCPFHGEKTPSFTVSPTKQFYHCFGCGAHGTAIGFLMEYEHQGFPDAVEELARSAGMEVPHQKEPGAHQDLDPLFGILEQAEGFFRRQLRGHPEAAKAVDYLKRRGLSGEIAAEFGLGYAPPGWDNLLRALARGPRERDALIRAGLVVEQPDKLYDRFRDRIMFPIRDRRGRTIGFGGRVLDEGQPKYLNSPETPLFHKGRELYGLYEARKALRRIDRLLVVEGYMDVIALAQFGIRNAVATLGTATTEDHLELLFRTTRELVFCFDGDRAGRDAAWKALNVALPQAREGRELRFLFLPEGEDPDSLVRKIGPESLNERLRTATPLSEFLFQQLAEQVDMDSLDGRARLVEDAKPLLQRLPAGVFREMMSARLGQIAGLPPNRLGMAPAPVPNSAPARPARSSGAARQRITPVRRAISLLLQRPDLAPRVTEVPDTWRRLKAPGIELLGRILDLASSQPTLNTAAIIERWRDSPEGPHLQKLATYDQEGTEEGLAEELTGVLEILNRQVRDEEAEFLYSKARPSDMTEDEKERLKRLLLRSPPVPRDGSDLE